MDFVRNALESNRDTSIVGQGEAFKTKRLNVNNAMPRDYYRYGDAKLLQSDRQCAQNIGQTARLGEGRTFCSNHQNAKVGHGELSYPFTSSRARCVARTTALISVTRRPPSSSSSIPSMVQPAGVVTISFSLAGCSPVCRTMLDAPRTICAANCVAASRGKPTLTPASIKDSMMM